MPTSVPATGEPNAADTTKPGKLQTRAITGLVAAALAFLVVGMFLVLALPFWWISDAPVTGTTPGAPTAVSVAAERTGLRTGSLAVLAALGAGIGLFYTHRNYMHQVAVAQAADREREVIDEDRRNQAALAQRTFVAERFNDAVKQLADAKVSVRVAGAYSLGSVAMQSPEQRQPVRDVLATVVSDYLEKALDRRPGADDEGEPPEDWAYTPLPSDVRATVAVLARLGVRPQLSLRESDLTNLDLTDASLPNTELSHAELTNTVFAGADLRGAQMWGAKCAGCDFRKAILTGAKMGGANLLDADFTGVSLSDVDIDGAAVWEGGLSTEQLAESSGEPDVVPFRLRDPSLPKQRNRPNAPNVSD